MLDKNITALRKRFGFTQVEFAKRLHVTQSAVSHWESGRSIPDTLQLFNIAELFGMTVDELTNNAVKTPPPAEQKKDLPSEREIDDAITALAEDLTPDELQRVADFVAGLKAARRP